MASATLAFFYIRLMYFLFFLYSSLTAHPNNSSVLSELCATLSRLAVRNEFCQDICDLGGLKLMMTLLADSYESAVNQLKKRGIVTQTDSTSRFFLAL